METMTAYVLAAALGIAIAVAIYFYEELELARAISESKSHRIKHHAATNTELYKKVKRMQSVLESDERLIESLDDERKKLKQQRDDYKVMFKQTVEGLEVARHQRDKAQYELSKLKANKASNHTYTIKVEGDELAKEIIKQMKEKYGKEIR